MEASFKGHAELVDFLLQRGADPNAKGAEGYTPLMMAALGGHTECTLSRVINIFVIKFFV